MATMRVPALTICFIFVLLIDIGLTVRDGFQPLPLRPQDQIKGEHDFVWDPIFDKSEMTKQLNQFQNVLEGLWDPRFDADRGRPMLFKSKAGLTRWNAKVSHLQSASLLLLLLMQVQAEL